MTAAPMEFVPIWDGIKAWVTALTGLNVSDVEWMDYPQGWSGAIQVRLNPTSMLLLNTELEYNDTGTDEDPNSGELEATQIGEAMLTVSISVRSRSQDPSKFGLRHAMQIAGGLQDTEQRAVLDALCISPVRVLRGPVMSNFNWDKRMEQVSTLDVQFSITSEQAQGAVAWFNKVEVSSETRNVDGSLLPDVMQLDDEEIGPPT